MKALLAIFPLQLVVFPKETVNLHIFEPRYKQMMNEADANGTLFGMTPYIKDRSLTWGTEVELQEIVEKYPDGKLDVRIVGRRLFKVENFLSRMPGRLYSGADIEYYDIDMEVDMEKNEKIMLLLQDLYKFLKMHKPLPKDAYSFNSYRIGHYIGLSLKEELKLLSIPEESKRQDYIIAHLDRIIPVLREMNALEKKVKMNGHFKNMIPPKL